MKKIVLVGIILSVIACNPKERAEKQLKQKKAKLEKIEGQIKELEKKVSPDTAEIFSIPVDILEVKPFTFHHYIEVSGNLEALNHAYISPEMGGQIKAIHVKNGQRVSKGDLLVSLNTDVTQATIREIKTGLELADTLFQRQKRLFEDGIGSEIQYLQAKSNKEQLEARLSATESQLKMSNIHAPFSGVVDEVFLKVGELASPGVPILQLVDLSKMKLIADVSEKYIPAIKVGESVLASFPTYPDMEIKVPVKRTGNVINKANRTFQVEVELNNPDNKLKPNMLGIIKINDYSKDSALVVPSIIIKKDIAKKGISDEFIFIVEDNNGVFEAKKLYVLTGISYKGKTVIESGLNVGDKVIVEGYNTVSSGVKVKF